MTSQRPLRLLLAVGAVLLSGLVVVAPAAADDDGVRTTGTCTRGSEISLRLRADDGELRIEAEIEAERRGSSWTVVVLHERRIVSRERLRARGDRVRLRRTVRDYFGSDAVLVRATGPRAETCRASATLTGERAARRS